MRKTIGAFTVLFILSGCTTYHHVPNPQTFELDAIPEFSTSKSISLVNAQESSATFEIRSRFTANLQEWTQAAIAITQKALEERGATIVENSAAQLDLSIASANSTRGAFGGRVYVYLKVKTGSGYKRTYEGTAGGQMIHRMTDGAIMRSVAAMFRDEKIVEYLSE